MEGCYGSNRTATTYEELIRWSRNPEVGGHHHHQNVAAANLLHLYRIEAFFQNITFFCIKPLTALRFGIIFFNSMFDSPTESACYSSTNSFLG